MTLTFDLEHLQRITCDVMKLCTKFKHNRAIRGEVIAILVFALRVAAGAPPRIPLGELTTSPQTPGITHPITYPLCAFGVSILGSSSVPHFSDRSYAAARRRWNVRESSVCMCIS